MIDLTLLLRALFRFLENNPIGTATQFITRSVRDGLGTQADIQRFLTAVGNRLYNAAFIDAPTWDAMIARLDVLITNENSPGEAMKRLEDILTEHVGRAFDEPEFEEIIVRNKIEDLTAAIDVLMLRQEKLVRGISWVENNMPAGKDKVAILKAIAFGVENLIDANLSFCIRERDEAQAILDDL